MTRSLEKQLSIRPMGVASKNDNGLKIILLIIRWCTSFLAFNAPY